MTYAAKQERRSQLNQVKTSVGLLAQEAPRERYELHAEIERVPERNRVVIAVAVATGRNHQVEGAIPTWLSD